VISPRQGIAIVEEMDQMSGVFRLDESLRDRQSLLGNLVEENERLRAQVSQLVCTIYLYLLLYDTVSFCSMMYHFIIEMARFCNMLPLVFSVSVLGMLIMVFLANRILVVENW